MTSKLAMRFKESFKNESGLNILEAVVTLAIFVIVMSVVVTFYITGVKVYREKSAERNLVFEAQSTTKKISDGVREASEVIESVVIDGVTFTSGTNSVVLELPSVDENGNTIYQAGNVVLFDHVIFEYDSGTGSVIKYVYPDAASSRPQEEGTTLMAGVDSIEFIYYPDDPPTNWDDIESIEMSFSAHKNYNGGTKQIDLTNRIKPRNK